MFSYILPIAVTYAVMSISEWFLHAKLMHDPRTRMGKFHIAHHQEVNNDMTLRMKKNDPYLSDAEWRGTGFSWRMIRRLMPLVIIMGAIGHLVFGTVSLVLVFLLFAYTVLVWNAVHPFMHGLSQPPFSYGPSLPLLIPDVWRNYLVSHHTKHHTYGGTRNFNVTLPGADVLFGSVAP